MRVLFRAMLLMGAICVSLMVSPPAIAGRSEKADALNQGLLRDLDAGNYEQGLEKGYKALELYKKAHGSNHQKVATVLNNISVVLGEMGDLEGSAKAIRDALQIRQVVYGDSHNLTILSMSNLAVSLHRLQELNEAEALYRKVIKLRAKVYGPSHIELATPLSSLGEFLREEGSYQEAETLQKRALKIYRSKFGDEHRDVLHTRMQIGNIYVDTGRLDLAEDIFLECTKGFERSLGIEHPLTARSFWKLGGVYHYLGDFVRAEPNYKKSLKNLVDTLGWEHPLSAAVLMDMAGMYEDMGNLEKAERGYRRSLSIQLKTLGEDNPHVAMTLNNLGSLLIEMGQNEEALITLNLSLDINRNYYGSSDARLSPTLNNIGELHKSRHEFSKAETYLRQAVELDRTIGRFDGTTQHNLAMTLEALGKFDEAITLHEEARNLEEKVARRVLTIGSQEQKAAFMDQLNTSTDHTLSLHLQLVPVNQRAAVVAMDTLLRRKGRALDAQTQTLKIIQQNMDAEGKRLIDELINLRTEASNIVINDSIEVAPEVKKRTLDELSSKIEKVENSLAKKSRSFSRQHTPANVASVASQLPNNSILAEFVVYSPYDPVTREFKPDHYGIYIVKPDGTVSGKDLGPAQPLNELIDRIRKSITHSKMGSMPFERDAAQTLHTTLLEPIYEAVPGVKHIFVAPDGALNILPFEALVDAKGMFAVQSSMFTYLTTGRDLLALGNVPLPHKSQGVLIADPDYNADVGLRQPRNEPTESELRGMALTSKHYWSQLPGAFAEVEAISELLPNSAVVSGVAATEGMVKKLRGPEVLHIATHGAFEAADVAEADSDPMFRSSLIFAGANSQKVGGEDGYLSAWEASTLDLWGTKMVVLSACETGLGDVRIGKGVFGLRRALVLAGTRSQVMSLWSVSDDATKSLMVDFYQRMLDGSPRGVALHSAKLALLNNKEFNHPFFWASFLHAGDWRPMWGDGNHL